MIMRSLLLQVMAVTSINLRSIGQRRWLSLSTVIAVALVVIVLLAFLAMGSFWGFFAMFMVLFFLSGVGNASTFQMIPAIMRKDMDRLMPLASVPDRLKEAEKEIKRLGGRAIYIETSSKPLYKPTQKFYLDNGYRIEAILKDFYDLNDDKLIFTKQLD